MYIGRLLFALLFALMASSVLVAFTSRSALSFNSSVEVTAPCRSDKLKAVAIYTSGVTKALAKSEKVFASVPNRTVDDDPKLAQTIEKATLRLVKTFAKADANGACDPAPVDAVAMQGLSMIPVVNTSTCLDGTPCVCTFTCDPPVMGASNVQGALFAHDFACATVASVSCRFSGSKVATRSCEPSAATQCLCQRSGGCSEPPSPAAHWHDCYGVGTCPFLGCPPITP
jgi:hypothetical protein